MLFEDIKKELRYLENIHFTGHLKFGIENGEIVSESITTKIDNTIFNNSNDVEIDIKKFYPVESETWGTVDYNFNFGRVVSSYFSINLQSEKLKERKRLLSCRSVKVVVKK